MMCVGGVIGDEQDLHFLRPRKHSGTGSSYPSNGHRENHR